MCGGGGGTITCPCPLKVQACPPLNQRPTLRSRVSGQDEVALKQYHSILANQNGHYYVADICTNKIY